ncbi:MAG: L-threonylcarbamoyladenylate synthase [Candidatus Methylomirabilota bacterium]
MKTRVIAVDTRNPQPEIITRAREALRLGGLVAFPTDTLYALGANALDPQAVERVFAIKGRHHGKPLSVLIDSVDAALALGELPDGVRDLMQSFWPGPLTVVVKASSKIPALLSAATGTIGLRMPGGAVARALLAAVDGPIIGTSANKAGGPDPADAQTVQRAVGGQIDLILDGGRVALGVPSTVIDCTRTPARVLREGAISKAALAERMLIA